MAIRRGGGYGVWAGVALVALVLAGCRSEPGTATAPPTAAVREHGEAGGAAGVGSGLESSETAGVSDSLEADETAPEPIPRFVEVDYIDAAAIARISKFRSGVGHDYADDFERCRSMKHYFQPRDGVDAASIPITAPVGGTVAEVRPEWAGTQLAIRADAQPDFTLVLFHIAPAHPFAAGDRVAAGERLGTHIGDQTMSDIAVRRATPEGMRLVSYFDVMTDRLFATYQARGLRQRADAVIPRAERDGQPLRCDGERFVGGEPAGDWVELLGKRLLSDPVAFADSGWRFRAGQAAGEDECWHGVAGHGSVDNSLGQWKPGPVERNGGGGRPHDTYNTLRAITWRRISLVPSPISVRRLSR